MGKRKLNRTTFYQCDWTGYPMRAAHCFMPTWNDAGKLLKRGCYANWECVVAHAYEIAKHGGPEETALRVVAFVEKLVGGKVHAAPHYSCLEHTKAPGLTALHQESFHELCTTQDPVYAVKIASTGDISDVVLQAPLGRIQFEEYLTGVGIASSFHSMRKKGAKHERDLTVFYHNDKTLPANPTASNLFKMQLYGDAILVYQSREASFKPRARYVDFTLAAYDEHFVVKKRKRAPDPQAMDPEAYDKLKSEMQEKLDDFEQKVSKKAKPPKQMSNVKEAVSSGVTLAAKLKERGLIPPTPLAPPAPPPVQVGA